jgi:putative transposase
MQVRYRYRIYPMPGQQQMLARTFGCARVVYNDCLRLRDACHAAGEKISDTKVQRRVITAAKATPERAWLGEVASVALVQACQDARRAYRNWFDSLSGKRKGRKAGRPAFRRKHQRQSIRLTRNGFSLRGERLYVAKVGEVKVAWSRDLPSVPSSVTVIREADGRYYASFVVEREATPLPASGREIGIDLGLASLAVTSDGEAVGNPRFLRPRTAGSPARSGNYPASRRAPRTRPRPGTGSRSCTARSGKPGSTTHTRSPCGWSATTKRSTPKTCACPGWPVPGWPSRCMTRAGRSSSG